ncbi:MAG: helix-turn-helix transcriptional regulator [Clostridia bacterium]|nr:helix-turn-helix transcriptional regulator [Clostridia bacterium]
MIHEFVGHREDYSTVPVSVVDFTYNYADRPIAAKIRPPFRPDPNIHLLFGTHIHDSLELLYVREGAMHIELNQDCVPLCAGEVLLMNPFDIHGGQIHPADEHVSYACLMLELKSYMLDFRNNHLDRMLSGILEGSLRFPSKFAAGEPITDRLAGIIDRLQPDYNQALIKVNEAVECRLMSGVYNLLAELAAAAYETPPDFAKGHDLMFIRSVNEYIYANYANPITVEDICAALGFGERNFFRLFRQNFGTTFISYLREFRIQRATQYFLGSNLPVTEIAAAVGFTDYCYFSRSFRRITGVSPSVYFKG